MIDLDSRYFNRAGQPIELMEWCRLSEDRGYKIVKQEDLWWGGWLSTVWLGLNHQHGDGPPLIFETMLFGPFGMSSLDMDRYTSEGQANIGHCQMKKKWTSFWRPLIIRLKCEWEYLDDAYPELYTEWNFDDRPDSKEDLEILNKIQAALEVLKKQD